MDWLAMWATGLVGSVLVACLGMIRVVVPRSCGDFTSSSILTAPIQPFSEKPWQQDACPSQSRSVHVLLAIGEGSCKDGLPLPRRPRLQHLATTTRMTISPFKHNIKFF